MRKIRVGSKVKYYQPGLDEILSSWARRSVSMNDPGGSLKEATVTKVEEAATSQGTQTFYLTEEGIILCDTDVREVLS